MGHCLGRLVSEAAAVLDRAVLRSLMLAMKGSPLANV